MANFAASTVTFALTSVNSNVSTPESQVQIAVRAGGLRDAFAECGSGDGLSYPDDVPAKRIDYLFLTGRIRCSSAKVIAG